MYLKTYLLNTLYNEVQYIQFITVKPAYSYHMWTQQVSWDMTLLGNGHTVHVVRVQITKTIWWVVMCYMYSKQYTWSVSIWLSFFFPAAVPNWSNSCSDILQESVTEINQKNKLSKPFTPSASSHLFTFLNVLFQMRF